ncbi:hypothetical protein E3N88_36752 [Mikania micrantha]|uniref:Uncharacterized protein n=1 Tax=Mikania micrantha TaxID=192012 RepID=A0A5N6M540_9ASTR|nr:hypothetical protein E3N88_36752 [Mikania micrantha]
MMWWMLPPTIQHVDTFTSTKQDILSDIDSLSFYLDSNIIGAVKNSRSVVRILSTFGHCNNLAPVFVPVNYFVSVSHRYFENNETSEHLAAIESCHQPQTSKHLAAVEIMRRGHIIIL